MHLIENISWHYSVHQSSVLHTTTPAMMYNGMCNHHFEPFAFQENNLSDYYGIFYPKIYSNALLRTSVALDVASWPAELNMPAPLSLPFLSGGPHK